jgi:hypothetical protein
MINSERSLIPNTKLEAWFLRSAGSKRIAEYTKLAEKKKLVHTASAYATNKLDKIIKFLVEYYERHGGDFELLDEALYRKTSGAKLITSK